MCYFFVLVPPKAHENANPPVNLPQSETSTICSEIGGAQCSEKNLRHTAALDNSVWHTLEFFII